MSAQLNLFSAPTPPPAPAALPVSAFTLGREPRDEVALQVARAAFSRALKTVGRFDEVRVGKHTDPAKLARVCNAILGRCENHLAYPSAYDWDEAARIVAGRGETK